MRAVLALAVSGLALAACSKEKPAEPVATAEAAAPAEPSKATATKSVSFTCQGDMPITAIYGTDLEGNPDVALIIQGSQFNLAPTEAPSGTRYASPYGTEVGKGIIWWEMSDDNVLLQQAPSEEVNNPDAGVTARICKVKTEPDPVPIRR